MAGDANTQRYVGNEPTGAVDPSGLEKRDKPPSGGLIGFFLNMRHAAKARELDRKLSESNRRRFYVDVNNHKYTGEISRGMYKERYDNLTEDAEALVVIHGLAHEIIAGAAVAKVRVTIRPAEPKAVVNLLSRYRSRRYYINGQTLLLDKSAMKHILERHHPVYWNGTVKAQQSFFPKNTTVADIENAIHNVLKQNPKRVAEIGANGVGNMPGVVNGVKYQLGIKQGRIGQFFPILE